MIISEYILIAIFGLIVGSFLNVCIYRIPKKLSIVLPRSFCPKCKTTIKAWENIPIISYIILGGKCSNCKESISVRYPLVEVLTAVMFLLVWHNLWFDLSLYRMLLNLFFVSILIIITFIDLDYLLIHDKITYPVIIIGLILQSIFSSLSQAIIGFFIGGGIIYLFILLGKLFYGQDGMGGGDVKLGALIGVYLGWKMTFLSIFLACVVGSIISGILIMLKKKKRSDYIAFGPFMALGAVVALFFGRRILDWYLYCRW